MSLFPFSRDAAAEGDKANSEVDEGHTLGRASSPWEARRTINFVNFAP
jgi:hypothetical protein